MLSSELKSAGALEINFGQFPSRFYTIAML